MNILGLSFDYHDAAAALLADGQILAAAQEERFSRKKNDASLPQKAAEFCLARAGMTANDLNAIVFYERTLTKFDRILDSSQSAGAWGGQYLESTLRDWFHRGKFDVPGRIAAMLAVPPDRITAIDHHQSHAASAFYCSPFPDATIVTLDGVGEYETATVSIGRGTEIRKLWATRIPDSLGLFYSAITAFLGFEVNEGEYKVMGMAAYGEPRFLEPLRPLLALEGDGGFRISKRHFDFLCPKALPYTQALVELLGPAREPESIFRIQSDDRESDPTAVASSRRYADIAASAQRLTEEAILHLVSKAVERTGVRNVCLSGGVALNSLANGRIERELGFPLFIQPAAGDAGGALGAALYHHHCVGGGARTPPLADAYLGRDYSMEDCRKALKHTPAETVREFADDRELFAEVARLITEGNVIGWLQGRFEWGPRALGARSILADPRRPEMQQVVNEKIKFREPFRPFAPSVLADRADEFFELPSGRCSPCPEDFMLSVCSVRPAMRSVVPAITHMDGTARVQLVRKDTNPRYFALLEAFDRITGVPLLLNTSFNRRGEPIVASPADALETFQWTGLDFLVLENLLVAKEK